MDELEKQGWVKQFSASEPRLSEMAELYQSLGFEVRLESVTPDGPDACQVCLTAEPEKHKMIWTRKKVIGNQ